MATHYHTDWVAPYWAERLVKMKQIGTHIFYRWTGGWGLPGAFTGRHLGVEPVIEKLAALASYVETPAPELNLTGEVLSITPAIGTERAETSQIGAPLVVAPQIVAPPVQEVMAPEPVPARTPPVLTNPLAPATADSPQRRTRIAVPR